MHISKLFDNSSSESGLRLDQYSSLCIPQPYWLMFIIYHFCKVDIEILYIEALPLFFYFYCINVLPTCLSVRHVYVCSLWIRRHPIPWNKLLLCSLCGAATLTRVLCRSSKYLYPWAISPAPAFSNDKYLLCFSLLGELFQDPSIRSSHWWRPSEKSRNNHEYDMSSRNKNW